MEREAKWAVALKKAKTAERIKSDIPLAVRKNQLQDRMLYYKNVLAGVAAEGNAAEKNKALETLIDLRANLLALKLEEIQELYGNIETTALEAEMQKYYEDCYRLAEAAS